MESAIYWSTKHGAMMVALEHEELEGVPWQAKEWVREDPGTRKQFPQNGQ